MARIRKQRGLYDSAAMRRMGSPRLANMALDDNERDEATMIAEPDRPQYPYGLRLSLGNGELAKLGLGSDIDIGDIIDLRCFAKVVSVNKSEIDGQPCCSVDLQVTDMMAENEMTEDENA